MLTPAIFLRMRVFKIDFRVKDLYDLKKVLMPRAKVKFAGYLVRKI